LRNRNGKPTQENVMLYTIALVLLALWFLGLMLDLVGGVIHVLLVIAAAVIIYRLVTGRKATP
jgi:4-hydroxybenzoate polyprenyltransferase